jgi:hypothetical protein
MIMRVPKRLLPMMTLACIGSVLGDTVDATRPSQVQQLAGLSMVVIIVLVCIIGSLFLYTLYTVLKPKKVLLGSEFVKAHSLRSFLSGILTVIVSLGVFMICDKLGEGIGHLLALLYLAILIYWAVSGLASVSHQLGERLLTNLNSDHLGSSVKCVLAGGMLFLGLAFLPFLGQFIQGIILTMALGLSVNMLLGLKRKDA